MINLRRPPLPTFNTKVSGETTAARMWVLCGVAVILGLVGGGAAVGLFKLIGLITHLVLLHNIGTSLPTLRNYSPSPIIIITAVGGAVIVSILAAWSPVIRGHGIPESLETILVKESRISPRAALAKPLSAAITIGTGGPFGAEGPIIVTAGSIGSLIGQVLDTSPVERRIMLATGAAAGMAGTFNAPIASIILALELVLFERSLRTVVPLAIACGIAASVHMLAFGTTPLFAIHVALHVGLAQLPLFALVGLASGVLAVVLNKGLFLAERGFRSLPVKIFWWPLIGAVGFSLIGLLVPRTLSMGYSAISDTLNGHFVVGMLAVLFVGKLFSWWISLSSQTSGGTLAPMFLVGATMGALFGHGLDSLFPGLGIVPAAFALVAMGATFAAAAKAPFTGAVFAFEVTGQYHMVIPLMIGVAAADLVAELFLSDRIMTEKLSHRGFRVDFKAEVDPLRMKVVGQAMHEPLTLPLASTPGDARVLLGLEGVPVAAAVDAHGAYAGLVLARDLATWRYRNAFEGGIAEVAADSTLSADGAGNTDVATSAIGQDRVVSAHEALRLGDAGIDVARQAGTAPVTASTGLPLCHVPPLAPTDFLVDALVVMIDHDLDEVPVVADGKLVGALARADIEAERVRAYRQLETVQPGWGREWAARLRERRTPAHPEVLDAPVTTSQLGAPEPEFVPEPALADLTPSASTVVELDERPRVPGPSEDDYQRLLHFRLGLSRYLQWSAGRIREAGLTPGEYELLLAIHGQTRGKRGPSLSDLSELLHVSERVLKTMTEPLLSAGLASRFEDPSAAGVTHLLLTDAGAACLAELAGLHATATDWYPPPLRT